MARGRVSLAVGAGISRAEFWGKHIAAREGSGVTIAQYCRDHGISCASFQWWKSELKRRKIPVVFAEVRMPLATNVVEGAIEVVVGGNRVVRVHSGFDEATLARVLAVVERCGC